MPKLSVYPLSGKKCSSKVISSFKGIDLSSAPANVEESRSPSAPNMMPDLSGRPVKRPGYILVHKFGSRINGFHRIRTADADMKLIHSGTALYNAADFTQVGSGLASNYSAGWQLGDKLWIVDGAHFLVYGLFDNLAYNPNDAASAAKTWQLRPASELAYIPTITISRNPTGGGKAYEPFNLIGTAFSEDFLGTAGTTVYQLSYGALDAAAVTAEIMTAGSSVAKRTWTALTEGTDFTVDRALGTVTFMTAPGISPIQGEDNVKIHAAKNIPEYHNRIEKCDCGILFGVNGAQNRLFLSGSPDMPASDWFSQMDNPAYFGESWYSELGGGSARVMGYSRYGDLLATHRAYGENDCNILLRRGTLLEGEPTFPVINSLQGPGAVSRLAFCSLGEEPLFLTARGIYALTAQDVTGDKYAQRRSFFIDRALQNEPELASACATVWRDFYIISTGGHVYLLDGSQKSYSQGAPYSTYQYECYYWDNIKARTLWNADGELFFGTITGNLFKFYTDTEDSASYNDNGAAISAHWDLPDFSGNRFYQNKSLRYVAVKLAAHTKTSVEVLAQISGIWKLLWSEALSFRYFSWTGLNWAAFTWDPDSGAKFCGRRRLVPHIDKAIIRIQNSELNEPFGIYEVGIEFSEKGKNRI